MTLPPFRDLDKGSSELGWAAEQAEWNDEGSRGLGRDMCYGFGRALYARVVGARLLGVQVRGGPYVVFTIASPSFLPGGRGDRDGAVGVGISYSSFVLYVRGSSLR